MHTTEEYLNQLDSDRLDLVHNIIEQGIAASENETFTTLVPKVRDIRGGTTGGGSAIEKGIIIHECNTSGNATKIEVVGMTSIPSYYIGNNNYTYNNALNRNLQEVILNPEITSIQSNAFMYSRQLKKISLPDGITSIQAEAFKQCVSLELDKLPNSLRGMGQSCFANCGKITIKEIPEGVTELANSTFALCPAITEMTIKGNITKLNYGVFNGTSLAKLVMPNITAVPTLLSTDAFSSTPISDKTGAIYVPDELVEGFTSTSNWSSFKTIIKPLSELDNIEE